VKDMVGNKARHSVEGVTGLWVKMDQETRCTMWCQ
jgi:hypothetical protein